MADRGALEPRPGPPRWPDPPPEPSRGSRALAVVRALRDGGWLRPRRIGCLLLVLLVLVWLALWALSSAVNSTIAVLDPPPPPITGNPLAPVAPTTPAGSGSYVLDRITQRGQLYVAIRNQDVPGVAERVRGAGTGSNNTEFGHYTGFDLALLEHLAKDLGVDLADIRMKRVSASFGESMLQPDRGEADLLLGGYEITPQRRAVVDVAGPYLTDPDYGFGLPPDDEVFRERVNAVLCRAIEEGTWADLHQQYLGAPAPAPPPLPC
jgi:ABC-type amino acid transport substrate-binding protein